MFISNLNKIEYTWKPVSDGLMCISSSKIADIRNKAIQSLYNVISASLSNQTSISQ